MSEITKEIDQHPWLPPTSFTLEQFKDSRDLLIGAESAKETLKNLGSIASIGSAVEVDASGISLVSSTYIRESLVPFIQEEEYWSIRKYGVYLINASEDVASTICHTLSNYDSTGLLHWKYDNEVELLGGSKVLKELVKLAREESEIKSSHLIDSADLTIPAANERLRRLRYMGSLTRVREKTGGKMFNYRLASSFSYSQ